MTFLFCGVLWGVSDFFNVCHVTLLHFISSVFLQLRHALLLHVAYLAYEFDCWRVELTHPEFVPVHVAKPPECIIRQKQ